MSDAAIVRRRTAGLRWRQGTINLVLALLAAWILRDWSPNFLVLGLFPFGMLRIVQGSELRLGLVLGGWTDIPATPPVLGCWAAAAVYLQQIFATGDARHTGPLLLWLVAGILLYAGGRAMQMRYYARYQREHAREAPPQGGAD